MNKCRSTTRYLLVVTLFLLLTAVQGLAQRASISGSVYYKKDPTSKKSKPVQGAKISATETKEGALASLHLSVGSITTDEFGKFILSDVPVNVTISIQATAFDEKTKVIYVGYTSARAGQNGVNVRPRDNPIEVSVMGIAKRKSHEPDQSTIALTAYRVPRLNESEQTPQAKGMETDVTGLVKPDDKKNPGQVRFTVVNLKTGEVVYDELLGIIRDQNGKSPRGYDFQIPLKAFGYYTLTILAEDYEPVHYVIINDGVANLYLLDERGKKETDFGHLSIELISLETKQQREEPDQLLEAELPTRHASFGPRLMQALPVPGPRSFDTFALLVPGVAPPPQSLGTNGPGVSPGVGTQGQFAVNGLRSRENNFNVDGSDNNDEDIGVRRQGFIFLVPQSIDSLQEFQILTALPDARFGRNAGGQVNALSQTGNVNFHGSTYGYFTDSRLNARDFFNRVNGAAQPNSPLRWQSDNAMVLLDGQPLVPRAPTGGKEPLTRTQAGLTLSGRVPSLTRTYFFGSFEQQMLHASKESHFAVPTVQQRGLFDTGDTGLLQLNPIIGGPPTFPASIPGDAIFSLYPFPNNPRGPYGANTYTTELPADGHGTRFSVKLDHQFNRDKAVHKGKWLRALFTSYGNQLTGRYNFTDDRSTLPVTGGALFSSLRPKVRTQNVAFFLNRVLSSKVSDVVRFSFGRTRLFFGEVRDPALVPSDFFPTTPLLLNAPLLLNVTAPNLNGKLNPPSYLSAASGGGAAIMTSLGYSSFKTTEQITGPIGQVIIPGFSPLGVDTEHFPQSRANNTFQIADTVTYLRGSQVVTFGADVRKVQINSTLERNFRPRAVFNGLLATPNPAAFTLTRPDGTPISTSTLTATTMAAAGVPTGFFQTLAAVPDPSIGIRFSQVNIFAQDARHLFSPRFRLTMGVRYEINTVPDTVGRRLEDAFDPQLLRQQAQSALQFCPAPRCNDLIPALTAAFPADFKVSFGADRNDLDGRLGAAWLLTDDGNTVLRGGFGYYDGQYPGIVLDQSRNAFSNFLPLNLANFPAVNKNASFLFNIANPNVQKFLSSPTTPGTLNTFPGLKAKSVAGSNPITLLTSRLAGAILGLDLVLPQRELKTPYAMHYALTLEHQFKGDYLASVAYVGTLGVKLLRVSTPDRGLNDSRLDNIIKLRSLTAANPFPDITGALLPAQSTIISQSFTIARTFFESSGRSNYNSLQVELRKRYSGGLQFGTALTYSHAVDDVSDFFDMAGAFALPQNSLQRSERADANFDVRLRSVTHFVYAFSKDSLLRNWQVSGIVTAQSGQPYTVNSVIDVNHDGNLTDRLNSTNGLVRGPIGGDRRIQLQLAPGVHPLSLLAPDGLDGVVGRNTFRAPGLFNVDLAFIRNVTIQDNLRLNFRIEIFNVLNRANYGIPVRILEAPGFGTSVNTTVPARMIQLGMKFQF
jgi:hypothetical protein